MTIKRILGATLFEEERCHFCVWAPFAERLQVEIIPTQGASYRVDMRCNREGYFAKTINQIREGDRYYYCFSGQKYPDPASDFQPEGIHGPSQIVQRSSVPEWKSKPWSEYVIYELHVGTYTKEGTFTAIIPYLNELQELGITAIELMPIAQFSGERNWGYDGVFPFAVQNSYGGPEGFKTFISACHKHDISVILDVVYNHLGPEGNIFEHFGPYFTDKYQGSWGKLLNFDDAYHHHIRRYFIENALHWFSEYGVDALRLDAVHTIIDTSAYSFVEELTQQVRQLSLEQHRPFYLTAENDFNNLRLLHSNQRGGCGMQAQWNNDFHHALHTILTKEQQSYYQDFGEIRQFLKAYHEGFVYTGEYSKYKKMPYGVHSNEIDAEKFVVFLQNHDQIGNRLSGDRLATMLSADKVRLGIGLVLCSPYIPLLFMGEEYGETAPFLYFISHENKALVEAVRQGRAREFGLNETDMPDPQARDTFTACKLQHSLKNEPKHKMLWHYYQALLSIRKEMKGFFGLKQAKTSVMVLKEQAIKISGASGEHYFTILANFSNGYIDYSSVFNSKPWILLINSSDGQWSGIQTNKKNSFKWLAPFGFMLYKKSRSGS